MLPYLKYSVWTVKVINNSTFGIAKWRAPSWGILRFRPASLLEIVVFESSQQSDTRNQLYVQQLGRTLIGVIYWWYLGGELCSGEVSQLRWLGAEFHRYIYWETDFLRQLLSYACFRLVQLLFNQIKFIFIAELLKTLVA